jgi:large subunit ribosomal protein L35Ae
VAGGQKELATKPELEKMKVTELRKLAEQLDIEAPSKMLKAQLVKAILGRQKATTAKPAKEKTPKVTIEKAQAIFVNYRQGMFNQKTRSILLRIPGVSDASTASKYIGRKVIWHSQTGKKLVGKIISIHGQGGTLLSRFRKGLPGQALGSTVEIV